MVIVIWSEHSVKSHWVRAEAAYALGKRKHSSTGFRDPAVKAIFSQILATGRAYQPNLVRTLFGPVALGGRLPGDAGRPKPRLGARTGKRGNRRVVGEAPPHFILSQQRDAEIAANSESLAVGTQAHGRAIDRAVARIENRAVLVGEPISAHAFDESQSEHRRVFLFALALGAAPLLWIFTARLRKNLDDLSFKLALALRDPKPSLGLAGIAELFPQAGRGRLLRPRRLRREARRRAQGHAKDEPEPLSHQ